MIRTHVYRSIAVQSEQSSDGTYAAWFWRTENGPRWRTCGHGDRGSAFARCRQAIDVGYRRDSARLLASVGLAEGRVRQ